MEITVNNVTDAFNVVPDRVVRKGIEVETRNGKAWYLTEPLLLLSLIHISEPTRPY